MIQTHVVEGPFGDSLKVFIVDHQEHVRRLLQYDGVDVYRWEDVDDESSSLRPDLHPTIVLPWDTGRALLESLVRHYNGAEDTRQLRKDYDAERNRVDNLCSALVDIARASAERGFRS